MRRHDVEDWKQPQRKSEGRGWAKMDSVTAPLTHAVTAPGLSVASDSAARGALASS